MKRKPELISFDTLPTPGKQRIYSKMTAHNLASLRGLFHPRIPENAPTSTKQWSEGLHGIVYGAVIGLLIGVYVLFFPLWITASPAWYTHAPWFVIIAVTTLTSMLLLGLGAAMLGSHVLKRTKHPLPSTH